jgi:hypothetical protein
MIATRLALCQLPQPLLPILVEWRTDMEGRFYGPFNTAVPAMGAFSGGIYAGYHLVQ